MQVSSSMKWDVLRIFSYSGRATRDVKQGMARLVKLPCSRRSILPMTSETSLSALRLVSATLSGSERSKVGVQLSGILTLKSASRERPRSPNSFLTCSPVNPDWCHR